MQTNRKQFTAFIPLLLLAVFLLAGAGKAEASAYYYFKTPLDGATFTVGDEIPISFYAGVVIKQTRMDAWGRPSSVEYQTMPVTLKVFKGNTELDSFPFEYTSGTTIETTYTPKQTGTLKLCIYGKNMGLNVTQQTLQDTIKIKVKKPAPSAIVTMKPEISVERLAKKKVEITNLTNLGKGMQIYRSEKKNGKYELIATTTAVKYTDTKIKATKEYFYKIRLYSKSGKKKYESLYSNKVKAELFSGAKITLSYSKSKGVKVTWKKINGAGYYLVGRNTVGTKGEYDVISCESNTTLTFYDKDVKKGKTYYYCVIAEKDDSSPAGKYMSASYKIKIPK